MHAAGAAGSPSWPKMTKKDSSEGAAGENQKSPSKDNRSKRESSSPQEEGKEKACSGDTDDKKAKKRRKVNHACVYCRRSHMTCDQTRPCSRCIKRDIGHLCHDEPREKRTKSEQDVEEADDGTSSLHDRSLSGEMTFSGQLPNIGQTDPGLGQINDPLVQHNTGDGKMQVSAETKMPGQTDFGDTSDQCKSMFTMYSSSLMMTVFTDWNAQSQLDFGDFNTFPYNNMFNTSEVNNEYNLLNDFLNTSLLDDGGIYNGEDPSSIFTDPSFANTLGPMAAPGSFLHNQTNQLTPVSQAADGNALTRPVSTARVDDRAQEKYYMTAADPGGTEPPEARMNKLLKAKYDAGLLKPFNYVKGYARLNEYMEKHMHPNSRQKILRQLDGFRPMFRERMQSLTDIELIRVEMWFEMKLMEYDRVFASMAIPACCWRRTGEIFRGNREMAEMINVPVERLREVSQVRSSECGIDD